MFLLHFFADFFQCSFGRHCSSHFFGKYVFWYMGKDFSSSFFVGICPSEILVDFFLRIVWWGCMSLEDFWWTCLLRRMSLQVSLQILFGLEICVHFFVFCHTWKRANITQPLAEGQLQNPLDKGPLHVSPRH